MDPLQKRITCLSAGKEAASHAVELQYVSVEKLRLKVKRWMDAVGGCMDAFSGISVAVSTLVGGEELHSRTL